MDEETRRQIDLSTSKTKWSKGMLAKRAVWELVFMPLVAFSPKPCGFWRKGLLRLFGAKIGPGCIISPGVKVLMPWNLTMGTNSWIGWDVDVYNYAHVTLGDNSVVSQYSYLCTATHDYERSDFPLVFAPIIVKDQAWVAARCFIGPGVTVHEGAVVGAQSVLFKDAAPWTVSAGNPCVAIKPRSVKPD